VLGGVIVLGGVLVLRGIAAAYVSACEANAQVNPIVAHFEAFFAALGAGCGVRAFLEMMAALHIPLCLQYNREG